METSKHITHPSHFFIDNSPYFLTASTYKHRKLLDDEIKTLLAVLIPQTLAEYGWSLDAWVILDNHYHLLSQSKQGKDLSKIIAKIHNISAQAIKAKFGIKTKIWSNYWDYCPRDEKDYNIRWCYLLNNPYNHGYVADLKDWEWSSFHEHYKDQGKEQLRKIFLEHIDYKTLNLKEDQESQTSL